VLSWCKKPEAPTTLHLGRLYLGSSVNATQLHGMGKHTSIGFPDEQRKEQEPLARMPKTQQNPRSLRQDLYRPCFRQASQAMVVDADRVPFSDHNVAMSLD